MDVPEIQRVEFENGDVAFAVELPIPPYGEGYFVAPDVSKASESLLRELSHNWDRLWPTMFELFRKAVKDYDVDVAFNVDEFIGTVQQLEDGVFMSDEADIFVRIRPASECVPVWDYFIRGSEVVHFQPVF